MRLDVIRWTRPRPATYESLVGGAEQMQDFGDGGDEVADEQYQPRQCPLQRGSSVCAVAAPGPRRHLCLLSCGIAHQRGQVIGQHLGSHVDEQRVLAQARDALQLESMLEPFEGLLDTPALVIELGKRMGGHRLLGQIGGQHN